MPMFRGTANCYLGCYAGGNRFAACISYDAFGQNMAMVTNMMIRVLVAAALGLGVCNYVEAQGAGPFSPLAGQWSGVGAIDLSNGARERIHCKAAYDVLSPESMQLNIRCASESYNFDLRGSAKLAGGAISGSWSESTRNAAGSLSGEAKGEHIQVLAKGPGFTATLTLTTRGERQTVVIKSQEPDSTVRGASISLKKT